MVKVRFAPSPTGQLHLGSARTAVFNWLYARHTGGKFVLRIEDTDLARSQDSHTDSIIRDMRWMGMDYDEFYKQSDRFDIYREYVQKLLESGKAYYCACTRDDIAARHAERQKAAGEEATEATRYDGHCRGRRDRPEGQSVVRLDIGPERWIAFKDAVKSKVSVNTKELDDYVILKSDNTPTYNFAVVVDDALMGITHIVRGEDHITNTAKQIILYEYFGFPVPQFGHLPLVLDKDRSPLSKRKGSTNIDAYRAQGILPSALLNAIARLGWSHGNDEIFTIPQLIEYFDLSKLNRSNAVYDAEKMTWVNGKHMKMTPAGSLIPLLEAFLQEAGLPKPGRMSDASWLLTAVELLKNRASTLRTLYDEMAQFAEDGFSMDDEAKNALTDYLKNETLAKASNEMIQAVLSAGDLTDLTGLENSIRGLAESSGLKFGDLMQVLRIRLTGKLKSPDTMTVLKLLGPEARRRLLDREDNRTI